MSTPTLKASRILTRIKHTVAEMNYAQRRLFEVQTGLPTASRSPSRRQIDELEALFRIKAI